MKNVTKALLDAQKQIKNAQKDAKNPHYRSNYATLESVIESVKSIANDCGLVIVQGMGANEFGQYVTTTVFHAESGEHISSKTYLALDKQNMQGVGSAITYARRYDLAAVFCITQTDDDENSGSINPMAAKYHQPSAEDGNPNAPHIYTIPFGKFKQRTLEEVGVDELANYIEYLEKKAQEQNKEITGQVREFIVNASKFIAAFERGL